MKKVKFRFWVVFVFFIFMMYTPVSITNAIPEKKDATITLNFIVRHGTDIWKPFKTAFLASQLAIDNNVGNIVFWSTPGSQWVTKAQTGQFDGAWGGGPTTFDQLANLDLLPEISNAQSLVVASGINDTISGVPIKRFNQTCTTDCTTNPVWIAAAISSFGFTLNYDTLAAAGISPEDAPKTWNDLADPKYYRAGDPLFGIGNAPDTTSNTKIYQIILQALGWEAGWGLITAISGNSEIYFGSTDVLTAVQLGQVGVGITIDFYGYSSQLQNPATKYQIPLGQSIINGDPISLLPGDPTKVDAANAFVQFVLSTEGQKIWLDTKINRLPVREDVFNTTEGQARPDLKAVFDNAKATTGVNFDDPRALETENFLLRYFQSTITNPHVEIRTEWGKIVNAYNAGKITRAELSDWVYSFGYPLVNETEAKAVDSSITLTMEGQWKSDMITQVKAIGTLASGTNPVANRTSPVDLFPPPPPPPPTSTTAATTTGATNSTMTSMPPSSSAPGGTTTTVLTTPPKTTTEAPTEISPGFDIFAVISLISFVTLIRNRRKQK